MGNRAAFEQRNDQQTPLGFKKIILATILRIAFKGGVLNVFHLHLQIYSPTFSTLVHASGGHPYEWYKMASFLPSASQICPIQVHQILFESSLLFSFSVAAKHLPTGFDSLTFNAPGLTSNNRAWDKMDECFSMIIFG